MKYYINLTNVTREKNRLTFFFDTNLGVFEEKSFFVDYGENLISDVPAVQNIPFAAVMVPICWATGAELKMSCIDKAFIAGLSEARKYFYRWRTPAWRFSETITADLVETVLSPQGSGLLFSGGLDALTSYIKHKDEKPALFTVFGTDIPLKQKAYIKKCEDRYRQFAAEQEIKVFFITTDVRAILDEGLAKYSKDWYGGITHGILLTALTAPVGCANVKTLYIASSHLGEPAHVYGSNCVSDNELRWCSTRVVHDNSEITRAQKISIYLRGSPDLYQCLRVCWMSFDHLNCSKCEKCLRTMTALLVNNIDPVLCNFNIDGTTFPALKKRLSSVIGWHRFFAAGEIVLSNWRDILKGFEPVATQNIHDSKAFLFWLRISGVLARKPNPWIYFLLRSPEQLLRFFRSLVPAPIRRNVKQFFGWTQY